MLQSINADRRLYVLKCGDGYSCLGFDYARRICNAVASWMNQPGWLMEAQDGTPEAYQQYLTAMDKGREYNRRTGLRCDAEIHPQLRRFLGDRVEVSSYGEIERFWVGRSTGWLPILLRITGRNSSGGCAVSADEQFDSVKLITSGGRHGRG